MDFFSLVEDVQAQLTKHRRLSRRGLLRGVNGDEETLEEVAAELIVRGVAEWDGDVLVRIDRVAASAVADPAHGDEAELRHMTVLFCDAVGSTALSERLDAETLSSVMRGFLEMAADAVGAFDGWVGGYQGDGLIAYFGYPAAREDAAERAVRAGLAMLATLAEYNERVRTVTGVDLSMRVGIHSGPVIVDRIAGTVTVFGKTANVASRIESAAPIDSVVISAATRRLVSGVFVLEDLGTREMKGVSEPVEISRVAGVGGTARRIASRTPLVGRDEELTTLRRLWRQAVDGRGHLVEIIGEAGIGKSRLVEALRESVAEDAVSWLDAACSPYARAAPLLPVLDLITRGLGLAADDPAREKRSRVERAVAATGLESPESIEAIAQLFDERHEDTTESPGVRRADALAALVEWVLAIAQVQPTIFVLEDAHWSDPTTQAFVSALAARIASERVLIIAVTRAEGAPEWRRRSNTVSLALDRIEREDVVELVLRVAGRALDADVVESIARRSDGVPLFVEELARTIDDHGDGSVPDTLRDLLMARLERLGAIREVAQAASVLGTDFTVDDLALALPGPRSDLNELVESAVDEEIFFTRGFGATREHYFKHALLRDAVYESMVGRVRRAHHLRYANALIAKRPTRAEERPDLVAEHFTLGEDRSSASEWWAYAADRAAAGAAATEAEYFRRRAIATAPPEDPARLVRLQLALIGALNSTRPAGRDPERERIWAEIVELTRGPEYAWERAVAASARGFDATVVADHATVREATAKARAIAEEIDARDVILGCLRDELTVSLFEGRPRDVMIQFEEIAARGLQSTPEYDAAFGTNALAMCHGLRSYALALLGRFEEAFAANTEASAIAEEARNLGTQTYLITLRSTIPLLQGNLPEFAALQDRYLATATRFEFNYFSRMALVTRTAAHAVLAPDPDLLRALDPALDRFATASNLSGLPIFAWQLAGAYAAGREWDSALRLATLAEDAARRTGQRWYDGQVLARRLLIQRHLGAVPDDWSEQIAACRRFTQEHSLVVGSLHLALVEGDLARGPAERDAAVRALRDAIAAVPDPHGSTTVAEAQELVAALS